MLNLNTKIRKFSLEEYLKSHNIDFEIKSKYFLLDECQSCRKEKKMVINIEDKFFTCFVCKSKGSLIDFIVLIDDVSKRAAIDLILRDKEYIETCHLNPDSLLTAQKGIDDLVLEIDEVSLPHYFTEINLEDDSEVSRYLLYRGFTDELISLFKIKYHEFSKRVIFPIYNHLDVLVGWQARDITDLSDVKILTKPDGLKKSLLLYNYNMFYNDDFITIVEGPIDAIKSYQYNAVAILGKKMSRHQIELIESNSNLRRIYIALDPNAIEEALDLAKNFSIMYDVRIVIDYFGHKDLGECTVEDANKIIGNALNYENMKNRISSSIKNAV